MELSSFKVLVKSGLLKLFKTENITRSQKTNFNIILSFIFRAGSILLQFALVPLLINYLKADTYGVWITISSVITWVAMLDIGIANGLKNKLTQSIAAGDMQKARAYVSTSYVLISLFAISLLSAYFLVSPFINWQSTFNSPFIAERQLTEIVTIVFVFFILKFVTDIINIVASAFQFTSLSSILLFISNASLFLTIVFLSSTSQKDLKLLVLALSFLPFLISILASLYLYLFVNRYKQIRPSLEFVNFTESRGLLSLGAKFFVLQIVTVIIFQTDNILIAHFFSPKDVAVFNVIYKYYSVVIILFSIVIAPYWTAFTDAYFKEDFQWLKSTMERLFFYWVLSLMLLLVMLLLGKWLIQIWVGNSIVVPFSLSISLFFLVAITNWNSILSHFLNGVGKLKLQIFCVIVVGVLNIPLTFFLVKVCNWGVSAMPASNFICLLLGAIICYIQYKKIINKNAKGVWNS